MTSRSFILGSLALCIVMLATSAGAAGLPDSERSFPYHEAAKQLDAGKYSSASAELRKILSQDPNNHVATLALARCYWYLGDYDQAVSYAGRAVSLAPNCAECHLWLGRAYGLKAEKSRSLLLARKSREEFQTAVRLDPNDLSAHRNLMDFYLEAPWYLGGSKDRAWSEVEAIASRSHLEGCLARADYWRELGQPQRAAEEYQEVLKLRPEQVEAYFQIADFYESEGVARDIEVAVRGAALIQPSDPRLDYYRGVARVLDGRELVEAEQDLKQYLSRAPERYDFPPHAAAHNWLGRIYERWGKMQEAIQQYKTALHLSPDDQTAQGRLHQLESN